MDTSEDKSLDFADPSGGEVVKKTHAEVLKSLLSRLPAQIDFAEHTATDPNNRQLPQHIGGIDEDKAAAALDKKISDFAEANRMTYAEAAANFMED